MSETLTLQAQGFCESMLVKGEWAEFHINVGRDYPVKLSTKKDDIKAQAMAAGQQQAVWTYAQMEGNPNPHRPGENYKKRYLNKVEIGGTLDPALAHEQAQQGGGPAGSSSGHPSPDGRESSIERQTIIKAAISVFPAASITTEDEWFALLTRMDTWIAAPRQPGTTPTEAAPPPATPAAQTPPPDDDIPF